MAQIQVQQQGQVALVEVSGRVDSSNADELGEALNGLIDEGRVRLVLDFSGVDFLSSAGLRELVSALKRVRGEQGDIRLAQPSSRVSEVLEISGLDTIFEIHASRSEALASF